MYYGESHTALDEKGRLLVPVDLRMVMEVNDHETWFLTRGFDGQVFLFHKEHWERLKEAVSQSSLDPKLLDFMRIFFGSSSKVRRDRQGRIGIPSYLRDYAGIDREGVLLGVRQHLELWSKAKWEAFLADQSVSYREMAGRLFGDLLNGSAATEGDVQGDND